MQKINQQKKTLIIMGTHPNGLNTFDWSRKDCDIWMFNEAANFKKPNGELLYPRADAIIQLHHEAIWKNPHNRSDKEHYAWLKSGKTPTIYMQKKYKDVPKSAEYPIKEILELLKNVSTVISGIKKDFKYFSSSPDYAFALVALMHKQGKKYEKVEVHGIELEMESEYRYQRTGFGFWIGYLAALGINVTLHNKVFDAPMYGYEGDVTIPSQEFENRILTLNDLLKEEPHYYSEEAKEFLERLPQLLRQDISKTIEFELNKLMKQNESAGIINGRIQENQKYLQKAKAMEEISGESVFSVGDFDGMRLALNRQYAQVRAEAMDTNSQITPLIKKLLQLKKGSQKRQRAIDEFGKHIATLMNKNMLIFHIVGAIKENEYYIDSVKESYLAVGGNN